MSFRGFVNLNERNLHVEHSPHKEGYPTLILLNGLSECTCDWDLFLQPLHDEGYGSLRFDFRGQGRSLQWEMEKHGAFHHSASAEDQAEDLRMLLEHFEIPAPYHFVGMSYGGGIGLHFAAHYPEKVAKLILAVPYLIRLDQAYPLQRAWMSQMEMMRGMSWLAGTALDTAQRFYHQFLTHYMDHRFCRAVPDPLVRQASIQLAFGIMQFNAFKVLSSLPASSVHLISVGRDTLVPPALYSEFWSKLPAEAKESWLSIEDGEHLLLEQYPVLLAQWVKLILQRDPRIRDGRKFRAQGYSFEVWDDRGERFSLQQRAPRSREQAI